MYKRVIHLLAHYFPRLFAQPTPRALRICARCNKQIKRSHRWSANAWDDRRPRHWNCTNPELTDETLPDQTKDTVEAQHEATEARPDKESQNEAQTWPAEG